MWKLKLKMMVEANRRLLYLWRDSRMGIYMKWLVVVFCIMISAGLTAIVEGEGYTIIMAGEGTTTVPADAASISVSVESSSDNVTQAQAEVQAKMDQCWMSSRRLELRMRIYCRASPAGLQVYQSSSKVCRSVNNTTVCENHTQPSLVLERSTVVRLNTTDESRMNEVLYAARSGTDAYVAGYSLTVRSKAVAEARQKAVANARENAEGASESGGSLGKVLDVSDYGYPGINGRSR